jgi:hypothetical protein
MTKTTLTHLLALLIALPLALGGCANDANPDARFFDDEALLELGSTHDLYIRADVRPQDLRVRVLGDEGLVRVSIEGTTGYFSGTHTVARVEALAEGSATIELLNGDDVVDALNVEVVHVPALHVDTALGLRGTLDIERVAIATGEQALLQLVGEDSLGRRVEFLGERVITGEPDVSMTVFFGELVAETDQPGDHSLTATREDGVDHPLTLHAVAREAVTALRIEVAVTERGTTVWALGETSDGFSVVNLMPELVAGAGGEGNEGSGTLELDPTVPAGTVVTATWNGLSASHTF